MVSFMRMISDLIPFAAVALFFYGIIPSFSFGQFNFLAGYSTILFFVLLVLLIIDFAFFGPPQEVTGLITLVLSALILQNWLLGIIIGVANYLLINFVGNADA